MTTSFNRATALEIKFSTEAILNFRLSASSYFIKDYSDIRIIVDGVEYRFTLEKFMELLNASVVK